MGQHPESVEGGGLEGGSAIEAMNKDTRGLREGRQDANEGLCGMVKGYLTQSQEMWLAFDRGC